MSKSQLMKYMRQAIIDYNMIANADSILVGLSGGKDSLTLLAMLADFRRRSKYKFPLAAGHVDLGFPCDLTPLVHFCQKLDVELFIQPTNIGQVVFDIRQETNPCSLCAKMRRGALNNLAKEKGFAKVALAHHADDVVETLLLNLSFEGRLDSFKPVTWLSRQELTVIRPFIYVPEAEIAAYSTKEKLPIVKSCCPANGKTKRQEMKELLAELVKIAPQAKERAITALQKLPASEWQLSQKLPSE